MLSVFKKCASGTSNMINCSVKSKHFSNFLRVVDLKRDRRKQIICFTDPLQCTCIYLVVNTVVARKNVLSCLSDFLFFCLTKATKSKQEVNLHKIKQFNLYPQVANSAVPFQLAWGLYPFSREGGKNCTFLFHPPDHDGSDREMCRDL